MYALKHFYISESWLLTNFIHITEASFVVFNPHRHNKTFTQTIVYSWIGPLDSIDVSQDIFCFFSKLKLLSMPVNPGGFAVHLNVHSVKHYIRSSPGSGD